MKKRRTHTCVICGVKFAGMGFNATPTAHGLCCKDCYWDKVMPQRIGALGGGEPGDEKGRKYGKT